MERRSHKLARMASTVLDTPPLPVNNGSAGQPQLVTAPNINPLAGPSAHSFVEQPSSLVMDHPQFPREPEPAEVIDEEEDEEEEEEPSAFGVLSAKNRWARGFGSFFGFSRTVAQMLIMLLAVTIWIAFEVLMSSAISCVVLLAVFLLVNITLLVATFILRFIWTCCLDLLATEAKIIPAFHQLLDPDAWILVWTVSVRTVWETYLRQTFNAGGTKTGYHRFLLLPKSWPMQYIQDYHVHYLYVVITIQIFWAIRNIVVEVVMYHILLGFLSNFRQPVLQYLNKYALLRRLNFNCVKLTPVMEYEYRREGADLAPVPLPSKLPHRKREHEMGDASSAFGAATVHGAFPRILERKTIQDVEKSSVANLLSITWIKLNPMILYVNREKCELKSKKVAKIVARMLFSELLTLRKQWAERAGGVMSSALTARQLLSGPSWSPLTLSPQLAPAVSPQQLMSTEETSGPLTKAKSYRIRIQEPNEPTNQTTGKTRPITEQIARELGIKNEEGVDDDTDDEIAEDVTTYDTRKNSLPKPDRTLPNTKGLRQAAAAAARPTTRPDAAVDEYVYSNPVIDQTLPIEVRRGPRRKTAPDPGVRSSPSEPFNAMPLVLGRKPHHQTAASANNGSGSKEKRYHKIPTDDDEDDWDSSPAAPDRRDELAASSSKPATQVKKDRSVRHGMTPPPQSQEEEKSVASNNEPSAAVFAEREAPIMAIKNSVSNSSNKPPGLAPSRSSHSSRTPPLNVDRTAFSKGGGQHGVDDWKKSTEKENEMMSDRKVAEVAANEIRRLNIVTANDENCLTKEFLAQFISQRDLVSLLQVLDSSKIGKITEKSFVRGVMNVHHLRNQIVTSLAAQMEIERVFHHVTSILITFVLFLCFLLMLGIPANTIIISGAASLSASGVVLSFVYTDFIVSIILIVFLNPYSIGDGVVIDGIYMVVRRITTYFTEFVGGDGKLVYYSHKQLSSMKLINQSRGLNAAWGFIFRVSDQVTPTQYDYLTKVLENYLKSKPLEWLPDLFIHWTSMQPYHFAEINIWVTCVDSWSSPAIWRVKTDFLQYVLRQCRVLGLVYRNPIQPYEAVTHARSSKDNNNNHNNNNSRSNGSSSIADVHGNGNLLQSASPNFGGSPPNGVAFLSQSFHNASVPDGPNVTYRSMGSQMGSNPFHSRVNSNVTYVDLTEDLHPLYYRQSPPYSQFSCDSEQSLAVESPHIKPHYETRCRLRPSQFS